MVQRRICLTRDGEAVALGRTRVGAREERARLPGTVAEPHHHPPVRHVPFLIGPTSARRRSVAVAILAVTFGSAMVVPALAASRDVSTRATAAPLAAQVLAAAEAEFAGIPGADVHAATSLATFNGDGGVVPVGALPAPVGGKLLSNAADDPTGPSPTKYLEHDCAAIRPTASSR